MGVGDFNGDGRDDLVVGESANNTYAVALSDGTKFNAPGSGVWKTGWSANARIIRTGDFTGDGKDDLLVADELTWAVATSTGSSFGGPGTGTWMTGWSTYVSFAGVADVDGDGRDDLVAGDGNVAEYYVALYDGTKLAGAPTGIKWKTGWSANAPFIGLTHGSRTVAYPTSYQYGGTDRAVNPTGEGTDYWDRTTVGNYTDAQGRKYIDKGTKVQVRYKTKGGGWVLHGALAALPGEVGTNRI